MVMGILIIKVYDILKEKFYLKIINIDSVDNYILYSFKFNC